MTLRVDLTTTRRRFVQFLAASPLFSHCSTRALAEDTPVPARLPDPMVWAPRELDNLISDPKEALDVFDFEPVAKKKLPPAHFGYMVTGIDDEVTLRANREGFLKFQLRPRRLVDVSTIDMTTADVRSGGPDVCSVPDADLTSTRKSQVCLAGVDLSRYYRRMIFQRVGQRP